MPNKETMQAAQLIRDAMELIREVGWCRHVLRDESGRLCARGALLTAAGAEWEKSLIVSHFGPCIDEHQRASYRMADHALAMQARDERHLNMAALNDASTEEHVLAVMEKTAINLESAVD